MSTILKIGVFCYLVCILLLVNQTNFIVDERDHVATISEIAAWQINSDTFTRNAQIPGYYFLMAPFIYVGVSSIQTLRTIQLPISIICIIIFGYLSKKVNTENINDWSIKILEFLTLPYISIFFVLVYNDVLSLLLVLLTFIYSTKKQHAVAAIVGTISILIRQNNSIWLLGICGYQFWNEYQNIKSPKNLALYLVKNAWYAIPFGVTAIFIYVNKGAALANTFASPLSFHVENIIFFFFSVGILFLPTIALTSKKIFESVYKNPKILAGVGGIITIYALWFKADNFFNSEHYNYHLRNLLLNTMKVSPILQGLFILMIIIGVIYLCSIKISKKIAVSFWATAIVFLGTSWLIEPRYHIIALTFLLLYKPSEKKWIEIVQILYFVGVNIVLLLGVLNGNYFM